MSRKNQQAGGGDAVSDSKSNGNPTGDTRHVDDPLITLAEFARRINKDRATVWRWARDGLFQTARAPNGLQSVRTSVANTFLGGTAIERRV